MPDDAPAPPSLPYAQPPREAKRPWSAAVFSLSAGVVAVGSLLILFVISAFDRGPSNIPGEAQLGKMLIFAALVMAIAFCSAVGFFTGLAALFAEPARRRLSLLGMFLSLLPWLTLGVLILWNR